MMKMNMPTEDAQDCMRELGERSMGNWFENMDTKNKLLDAAITIINMNKKYSGIKESAVSDVEQAIGVSKEDAEILVEKYW